MKTFFALFIVGVIGLISIPAWGDFPVRVSNNKDNHPVAIYNPTNNEYLVAWEEYIPLGGDLYLIGPVMGQRFKEDGTKIGNPFQIFDKGVYPTITYNSKSNEYLVVILWADIKGQRLSATGNKIGNPVTLMVNANYPKILYNDLADKYFLAAYNYTPNPHRLYVRRISTDLQTLQPNKDISVWTDSTFALTYAPIAPKGRYLLSEWPEGHKLLDWEGNLIQSVGLETGYPKGGYADGHGYSGSNVGDAWIESAFGYKDGNPVFMIVYDDMNNKWPWPEVPGVSATLGGVWGAYIDAVNPPSTVTNTYFPVTDIQLIRWHYAKMETKSGLQ